MYFNNYWLEGAALIIDTIILYMLISRKTLILNFSNDFIRFFLSAYFAALFGLGQSVVEALISINFITGKAGAPYIAFFCYGFFITHMLCAVFFAIYEHAVLDIAIKSIPSLLLIYAPIFVTLFAIAMNPFTGNIFRIDENGVYYRGDMISLLYIVGLYYLFYIIYVIQKYGKNIKNDKSIAFTYLPLIPIAATILQMLMSGYYVENFGLALMIILVYIAIEKPSDYIDAVTGLQNSESFFMNFKISMNMNKASTLLVINIKNIEAWDREIGSHANNMLLVDIAGFLSDLSKSVSVYCLNRGVFGIYISLENAWVNQSEALDLIRMINDRFKIPFSIKGYKILYSQTTCLLRCPVDANNEFTLQELFKLIQLESYVASKGYVDIHDIVVDNTDKEQLIASKMKSIRNSDNMRFLFLPEYNTKTGEFDSVKTELTLFISEIGAVRPNTFIPIAERNGLIDDLSNYMIEKLFKKIRQNNLDQIGIKNINIIMPTSVLVKITESNQIAELAQKYGIPPSLICFELAKNSLIKYESRIAISMRYLVNKGFKFSLENYGNGYTNASSLIKLPLYNVTLDKELTNAALTSEIANNLVKCSIKFLKDFGFSVKAEHIEQGNTKEYAEKSGFDYLQGYVFSSPLSARELAGFVKGNK